MSVNLPPESGPTLDRRIARLIDGPRRVAPEPPYSTDEAASNDLAARFRPLGIDAALERDGDYWYCVFWAPRAGDEVRERMASGSAPTRALAICRAVLNLPLSGTGRGLKLRTASRGWIDPKDEIRPATFDGRSGADSRSGEVPATEPVTGDATESSEAHPAARGS